MKSTTFLAIGGAVLAMASPLHNRVDARALKTKWVTDVVTVVVTAGDEPTAAVFKEAPAPAPTTVIKVNKKPPPPQKKPAPPPPPPAVTTTAPPPPPVVEAPPPPKPKPSTSAPPPPVSSKPDPSDYEGTMLNQHNLHRANHSAPALEWDSTLASYASNTAHTCVFEHDMDQGSGGYGQNLASWGSTADIDSMEVQTGAQGVTEQWYNGEMPLWQYYGSNPPSGSDFHAWGHFTQVVWKSTTKVGCATVKCPAGSVLSYPSWYTVCNYDPPGNYGGEYNSNVLAPKGMAIETV